MLRSFLLEWHAPLLALAALLTLLLWYLLYFRAMAPRKGTLEWIALTDLPPISRPAVQPIRGVRWIAPPLAALLGAANCLLRMEAVLPGSLIHAALPAAAAVLFCLLLLHLFGSTTAALCGTALFLACGTPALILIPVLAALWMFALFCMLRGTGLRILCLLLALAGAACALWLGCGGFPPAISDPLGFIRAFSLSRYDNLPAAVMFTAVVIEFIQAARLHRGQSLLSALLALLCAALSVLHMPELLYAGGAIALSGTFAAAQRRRFTPIAITIVLLDWIVMCTYFLYFT